MKILYIKCNSERAKEFQLRTVIFEDGGKIYVSKEAINSQATEHILNMQKNYDLLNSSIVNSKLKLVPIVSSSDKKVIFEFLEGKGLDKIFSTASNEKKVEILSDYKDILENSFKSTTFDSKAMVNDRFKAIFGNFDYSILDGLKCYDGVTNLDMIFSNFILVKDGLYLIDYEWSFELSLPIDYILYRTYLMLPDSAKELANWEFENIELFHKMERHFIDSYVMKDGFYFYKNNYIKLNMPIEETLRAKDEHIKGLEEHVKILEDGIEECKKTHIKLKEAYKELDKTNQELVYTQETVKLRDMQIQYLLPKNRIKNLIKKLNPLNKEEIINPFDPALEPVKSRTPNYNCKHEELTQEIKTEIKNFAKKPLISIITPVYNVEPKWLEKAIKSVEAQWYSNWELCIVDDCSTNIETKEYLKSINNPKIKIKFLDKNLNISGASNEALKMASGEYISLLDNDDELTPNALYEMVKEINRSSADFIYSDEDFIDTDGVCSNPHYKPDFSPDLLLSHNYITHLTCFKKELLDSAGWFKSQFDGAQDYELFLRMTEKANKISHIPKILYHWRMIEGSTSANSEAKPEAMRRAKMALEETLKRRGIDAKVEYGNINHYFRVRYTIKDNPLVSIIIPFKDKPELLDMCVNSILQKSSYINYEIIGVSNNSKDEATFEKMKELEKKDPRVKFYEYNIEFNYAKINNYAVENFAKGEHILLLNNDIEVINSDWIEAMLEHSQREEVGCVGAKLYYPNDTIQHAGIIIGLGGYAGHSHKHLPRDFNGYFNRLMVVQNVSAITAACLMIKRGIYSEVDGMDEVKFKVAYNDVDFCLRVRERGYLNIFTPYTQLYHHESISRGYETTPEKIARFQREKDALFERHKEILTNGDPYYNPNLCHDKEDFSICPKK